MEPVHVGLILLCKLDGQIHGETISNILNVTHPSRNIKTQHVHYYMMQQSWESILVKVLARKVSKQTFF